MSKVVVIGAGAAGMFAAVWAAKEGHEVTVLEKNEKVGKKLFITGKGRCNLTNDCDRDALLSSVVTNPKFLYSSFYGFGNQEAREYFETIGVRTKVERGGRVFPVSDHSSDVVRGLARQMEKLGVRLLLKKEVAKVCQKDGVFFKVILKDQSVIPADACIIATGGASYPSTGSTGDGYRFAKALGHSLTDRIPALVPMEAKESWVKDLQGLSLRHVRIAIYDGGKKLYEDFGEMLFTHFGVSGPVILSASSFVGKALSRKELSLFLDLKPALSVEQMERRLSRDFEENGNRQLKNSLGKLFPSRMIPVMVRWSGIAPERKVSGVTKEERQRFAERIKHLPLTLTKPRGFDEAVITQGGVSVKEVHPGTMESKLVKGVYFAGEVLDLDAVTGGFNLQIAWSTGYAAGHGIP